MLCESWKFIRAGRRNYTIVKKTGFSNIWIRFCG